MPQDVSLLTWNVQQYGAAKTGFADVLGSLAQVVARQRPDVLVLLELTATPTAPARELAYQLASALQAAAYDRYQANEYQLAVLSPAAGTSFYAYFVRDPGKTMPLLAYKLGGAGQGSEAPVTTIGGGGDDFQEVFFRAPRLGAGIEVLEGFPFLAPDLAEEPASKPAEDPRQPPLTGRDGSPAGDQDPDAPKPPKWPKRQPVLGLFRCAEAKAPNQLLPLVACAFAASETTASQQFDACRYLRLLRGIGPRPPAAPDAADGKKEGDGPPSPPAPAPAPAPPAPVAVQLRDSPAGPPTPHVLNYYVLTGGFTTHYPDPLYDALTGEAAPNLGARVATITPGLTHTGLTQLMGYDRFGPKTTELLKLLLDRTDNFLLRVDPAVDCPARAGDAEVVLVPALVQDQTLAFGPAVGSPAALDKTGFGSRLYGSFTTHFAREVLRGRLAGSPLDLQATLVGSRLLSDHLPLSFTLTIA